VSGISTVGLVILTLFFALITWLGRTAFMLTRARYIYAALMLIYVPLVAYEGVTATHIPLALRVIQLFCLALLVLTAFLAWPSGKSIAAEKLISGVVPNVVEDAWSDPGYIVHRSGHFEEPDHKAISILVRHYFELTKRGTSEEAALTRIREIVTTCPRKTTESSGIDYYSQGGQEGLEQHYGAAITRLDTAKLREMLRDERFPPQTGQVKE
jgi:hypothetical protein